MEHGINVCVEQGCLRVIGEIPVSSGKEGLEAFLSDLSFKLLGNKKTPKLHSFGQSQRVLTESEAAVYIGRSKSFLRKCRTKGGAGDGIRGPKFTRDGQRGIRYPVAELDKWLASRKTYEANCEAMADD